MRTVLVVDDDADIRDLIAWKLAQTGYGVLTEADGEAGLVTAAGLSETGVLGSCPDLVPLDWRMPKMSGIDVCRVLRADPVTAAEALAAISPLGVTVLEGVAVDEHHPAAPRARRALVARRSAPAAHQSAPLSGG